MTLRMRAKIGIILAIVAATSMGVEPVSLTVTIVIAVICLILGVIASFVASWWFSTPPPPVPICQSLGFVRSVREGDDQKCTYTNGSVEITVMLTAMQRQHPDLQGCPNSIHLR